MKRKRILIAPLDWGLGHATRCIPIIQELLAKNVEVLIAADNRPAKLLQKEFPNLEHVHYPGYTIDYPATANMAWTISRQLHIFFSGVAQEQKVLETIVDEHSIDAVISDNRWGAYSKRVPSVYIVHQLHILLPPMIRWGEWIVEFANLRLIRHFNEMWIPDVDSEENLTGKLSHFPSRPKNSFFIGPLSRMQKSSVREQRRDILVVLSGPEPQRTIFEELIIAQLKQTEYKTLVVRGTPEQNATMRLTEHLTLVSSLQSGELSEAIAESGSVISRPGYSTVMDLSFLGANAIFVPTPQQTEQEFLARRLKEKQFCYSETQNEFSLERALTESRKYSGLPQIQNDGAALRQRIDHLLDMIP